MSTKVIGHRNTMDYTNAIDTYQIEAHTTWPDSLIIVTFILLKAHTSHTLISVLHKCVKIKYQNIILH